MVVKCRRVRADALDRCIQSGLPIAERRVGVQLIDNARVLDRDARLPWKGSIADAEPEQEGRLVAQACRPDVSRFRQRTLRDLRNAGIRADPPLDRWAWC
jgi:hypothetical protein